METFITKINKVYIKKHYIFAATLKGVFALMQSEIIPIEPGQVMLLRKLDEIVFCKSPLNFTSFIL